MSRAAEPARPPARARPQRERARDVRPVARARTRARAAGAGARRARPRSGRSRAATRWSRTAPASRWARLPRPAPPARCGCVSTTAPSTPSRTPNDDERPTYETGGRRGSRRSSAASTRARPGCARRSTLVKEGRDLVEYCAGELDAVGQGPRGAAARRAGGAAAREPRPSGVSDEHVRSARRPPARGRGLHARGPGAEVSSGFERLTHRRPSYGGGLEGVGEDVVYDAGTTSRSRRPVRSMRARRTATRSGVL